MQKQIILEIKELPDGKLSVLAWSAHQNGMRGTAIEPNNRTIKLLKTLMNKTLAKHISESRQAIKRSWKEIKDGRPQKKMVHDQFLLHKLNKLK